MSYLISDVYSVTPGKAIEWHFYVLDISEDDPAGTVEGKRAAPAVPRHHRQCAGAGVRRTIAGWQPLRPVKQLPKVPRLRRVR
jgi:hypothetical protein